VSDVGTLDRADDFALSVVPAPSTSIAEYQERVQFLRLVKKLWPPMLSAAQRWVGPPGEYRQVDAGRVHLAPLHEHVTICGRAIAEHYIDHGAGKPWLQGLPNEGLCRTCQRSING